MLGGHFYGGEVIGAATGALEAAHAWDAAGLHNDRFLAEQEAALKMDRSSPQADVLFHDAINKANIGVTASIVNDGAGDATSVR